MDSRRRAILAAGLGYAVQALPQEKVKLPRIGLGTWQTFDVGGSDAARTPLRDVLKVFTAAGARAVDSSPMYGSSESVAGDLIAELGLRDKLFV